MAKIIGQLFRGELYPEENLSKTAEGELASKKLEAAYEPLFHALTDSQKKLFSEYESAQTDLLLTTNEEAFVRGFKIGARMALEMLADERNVSDAESRLLSRLDL